MKTLAQVLCGALLCLGAMAQDHAAHVQTHPVTLVTGLGDLHHPVSTHNPQAQQFFDQGLRFIYAFNHDEAARSFQHAAELDPKLAMAYWGVAEAVGPNYNDPADPDRYKHAHDAVQKAVDLSAGASPSEQAYIQAMAKRFPADPNSDLKKAAEDYHDAMRQVSAEFPDDLDAATLFAESGMNLHPWGLWHQDGTPEAGTEEIVATLESVMKRDPNHLGAIHYYIHTVEASNNPERALAGANKLAALAPGAGHIVHMPAHVYIRTGDYDAAVKTNEQAACRRSRLHQGERRAGHLPDDVLQPQPALHRDVRRHEWPLRRGAEECRPARRERRATRQRHAAARGFHDHPHGGGNSFPSLERDSQNAGARSRHENGDRLLALRPRFGLGWNRQNS